MTFSVIIPSHKRKPLLSSLLKSLENQKLPKEDFEVIVVATENDEAFELENQKWELNISFCFVPADPSRGRSASIKRNHGAKKAQAPWIAFIDDDCLASSEWLSSAKRIIDTQDVHFIEGQVVIPEPQQKTFTYKGIQRLSKPGGFQTCNMFYKKSDFIELGGFDPNFPYYLEDTDLGWTFQEAGKNYVYVEDAQVSHPVPPAQPKKMMDSSFRMEKLPYLFKKHPHTFRASQMRALPRPYFVLALFDMAMLFCLFLNPLTALLLLSGRLVATLALLTRMLKGCHWQWSEALSMYYYLCICPMISLVYLVRGNLQNKVWLFLR